MAKLQVALDFINLSRAMKAAEEAVAGGADILEVGTPLIKSDGLEAVRRLRSRYPGIEIVADMKTMDGGRTETEIASKAGASWIFVMAAASDTTIAECVDAGRNYGIKVGVDLLGAADAVQRAREVAALGVDLVNVHTPVDDQMVGRDPFDLLRAIREAVDVSISVAGGINSENVVKAIAGGADVVVVGGAIIKAADAEAAAREIKQAMETGRAVETTLFKRGGAEDVARIFAQVAAANICDAMHRRGALPGVRPVWPVEKMVGRAFTVRTFPGDWAKPVEAIEHADPGDVIVVEAGGIGPAVWGELATESCVQRGLAGIVIDGAIRDVDEIQRMKFPAFARLVQPNAGEPKGLGEMRVPVRLAGTPIEPGDWIVGDGDGVVAVPQRKAVETANRAMDVLEKENRIRAEIHKGGTLSGVTELLKWEKR